MAFENATATDLDDLVSKLFTFATTLAGWTQDELDTASANRHGTLHKNNVYVSFGWIDTSPSHLSIWQSLGWINASTDPWNHTDDAGGLTVFDNVDQRGAQNIGDGPFDYWFFSGNGTDEYLHVVVKLSDDTYRHFGFGEIEKFGVWTGGEYAYGTSWDSALVATDDQTTVGLDGGFASTVGNEPNRSATLHLEGLDGMDPAAKWGQVWGSADQSLDDLLPDRSSEQRVTVQGGMRGGPFTHGFFWLPENGFSADVMFVPIGLWYLKNPASGVGFAMYLGSQPDCRMLNMNSFNAEETVVINADTWHIFPAIKKSTAGPGIQSANLGIAYKEVA